MRNILVVAVVGALLAATPAFAQQTTGRINGRVTAAGSNAPVSGATVIAVGPQGEEATLTDDNGDYAIDPLTIGTYVVRVFPPGETTPTEKQGLAVSAGATLRVNVTTGVAATAPSETIVVRRRAPMLDLGTSRTGLTLNEEQLRSLPLGRTFGDVLQLAPGAFVDSSGNVSIAGASGLENTYVLDGMNVTGLEYGDIMSSRRDSSGGSNLPIEFVRELQVQTGGFGAEYGGAMGGVVNVVTKSGSNEWHGTAFTLATPSFLVGSPRTPGNLGSVLTGRHVEGNDINVGFEVGGPIIRNKLFFWAGFAPRFEGGHFDRQTLGRIDANGDGMADLDAAGNPRTTLLGTQRADEWRRTYNFGTKITYLVAPDHRLDVSLFGSPTRTRTIYRDPLAGPDYAGDLHALTNDFNKDNVDAIANWTSNLFDRHWKIEASAGVHHESYTNESPFSDVNARQQIESHGTNLYTLEGPAAAGCMRDPVTGFDPCPVDVYKGGGFGLVKHFDANREMLELKSTHLFGLGGRHELKYGVRAEFNQLDLDRHYSGPVGDRRLWQIFPDNSIQWNAFTLPKGRYPFEFNGDPTVLGSAPFYQDQLVANVKSDSQAFFAQDAYSPLPNLTLNVGLRYERQNLYDFHGEKFAQLDNWGPRVGAIYDPSSDGRSKIFAHYGRFFEAVPLNLAARYFGGEGLLLTFHDTASCPVSPYTWKGTGGEKAGCNVNGASPYNNGSNYPVQPRLRGQFHDEVVGGVQHQVSDDLAVGATFTRRWLGSVIEDGTATDGTFVLANPGNIPDAALKDVEKEVAAKQAQLDLATSDAERVLRMTEVAALQSKLDNLRGLSKQPKPERTYTALTLNASTRVTKRMSVHASYTYSRLIGNYNGLYDADNQYAGPNGNNAYDTPDLVVNRKGPLANDRPHSARLTGFYEIPVPQGSIVLGSVVSVFSGVPRNYVAGWVQGQQLTFLLPRGSAGRTPTITQVDARASYRRALPGDTGLELFVEVFNVLNSRTATMLDDNYSYDVAAPIKNGTKADLAYARNAGGQPLTLNPNFGNPLRFQAPIHGRLGLRYTF